MGGFTPKTARSLLPNILGREAPNPCNVQPATARSFHQRCLVHTTRNQPLQQDAIGVLGIVCRLYLMSQPVSPLEPPSETCALLAGHSSDPNHRPWFNEVGRAVFRVYRETWITIKATLLYSLSNLLLPLVPLGILAAEYKWSPTVVFVLNFLAMLPLASMLTFSTEQLAAKVGSIVGGLINATFGNAVEMIVSRFW